VSEGPQVTINIVDPNQPDDYCVINLADYDPELHMPWDDESWAKVGERGRLMAADPPPPKPKRSKRTKATEGGEG
jgi:hypothetical protein